MGMLDVGSLLTWCAGALHARRRVHCVAKYAELGQLAPHHTADTGAGVDADADDYGGAVIWHEDLLDSITAQCEAWTHRQPIFLSLEHISS